MKLLKSITVFTLLFFITIANSQKIEVSRVEPPNWWIGMENSTVQLLIYGKNISETKPKIDYNGVQIKTVTQLESRNYLFVDLQINETTEPGKFPIDFYKGKKKKASFSYELNYKSNRKFKELSVNGSDVMYLITPDRFANGDPSNDNTDDTIEKLDRSNPDGRHGGDIKGIIDHFDYVENLGVTALWLNPFLENDQPKYSYHGYGISDFYKTDSRFGTNEDFIKLTELCHEKGMKMIMDQVFNHCGSGHWWMNDLPSKDWLNQWETYTNSSFTNISVSDPYSSKSDRKLHTKGWFDTNLPDLNQENPYMETYLIQNSIWWIETAQLDGIRMDTYPYPEKETMARWLDRIEEEYPNFYIVAETSELNVASLSYWNSGKTNKDGYTPNAKSVSDYPLYYALLKSFGKDNQAYWIYEALAYDYLYGTPFYNKVFNGNHDVPRLYNELDGNKDKIKLSMAFVLTTRGIPQVYYGDELLFEGPKPDGILRKDFPGGWLGDNKNLFKDNERTKDQKEVHDYVQTILQWRKNAEEIHHGQLKHYKPSPRGKETVYVYFRYLKNKSTMIILNNGNEDIDDFLLNHYQESLNGYTRGKDIITNTTYNSLKTISLKANTAYIIELR